MLKWSIYNALFFVAYLAMMPSFLLRMKRRGGYRARMGDRFGRYPYDVRRRLDEFARGGVVWVHAVSVGEVQVAAQLMEEMRRTSPDVRFVFSTTSSTGWKTAEKLLDPRDALIYNPLDFNGCVKRALDVVRPRAVILTETEIWPNFIRALKRRGVPLYLVNARVSDRSAPRYRALRWFFGEVLRCFTRIFAQSDLDAERLIAAGADPAAVEVTGSFKFDVAKRNPAKERELRGWVGDGDVLLGGSTWPGEDSMMLRAYAELVKTRPDVKLVIAPRHFEKADAVEANIRAAGFSVVRRSRGDENPQSPILNSQFPVYLCDTTGEMMGLFGIAKVAFVGKSLCAHGSQNMIEPCLCGVPTVVGPYTENFRPVMSDLLAAGALVQTPDAPAPEEREAAVVAALLKFFAEPEYARGFAERAVAAVERRRGVTGRVAKQLLDEIGRAARPEAAPSSVLKRHWKIVVAIAALAYALAALFGTQPLKHSWKYLQMNPNRSYSTFVGLSAASLALPWCISDARRAYAGITAPVEWPGVDEEGVMRYRATDALKGLIPAIFPGKESLAFDARLRSMAELRRLHWRCVEKWGGYRLWCIGRWDYVLVAKFPMGGDAPSAGPVKAEAGDVVSADELFADFSARFDDFSAAGIYSPAQVFACYVGDDMEVGPALMASTSFPRWDAFWSGALPGRLAFKPVPGGGRAAVRASRLTPEEQPSMDWLKRGKSDASVYLDFLDSVAAAQDARRSVLVGFDVADAGGASATNAISLWAAAAKVNPRDPILMNLADTFDQQGRRFLAIGNVKGAMNCYENRILVQPHDVAAVHNFGVCLKRGGHFDAAAKIFMKAAKMTPDNEPHLLEFADCAAAAQHHEDAIKVLETLKKKRPGDRELDRRISKIKSALYRKNIKEYYK
jgi:3-deoxy-D-manno-octulosonic-acid transferase